MKPYIRSAIFLVWIISIQCVQILHEREIGLLRKQLQPPQKVHAVPEIQNNVGRVMNGPANDFSGQILSLCGPDGIAIAFERPQDLTNFFTNGLTIWCNAGPLQTNAIGFRYAEINFGSIVKFTKE